MSRWGTTLAAAAGLGASASLADSWVQPGPGYEWKLAVSLVTNAASLWAGLAILAGWLLRRPLEAVLGGPVALVVATLVYYAVGVTVGDRKGSLGSEALVGTVEHWLVMGVLTGPLLGLVGALMHRSDVLGRLACVIFPLGVTVDMLRFHDLSRASFEILPVSAGAQVLMIVVSVGLATAAVLGSPGVRAPVEPVPR